MLIDERMNLTMWYIITSSNETRKPEKLKFGYSDRPNLLYEVKHMVLKLT
jgi:hypothetical protein